MHLREARIQAPLERLESTPHFENDVQVLRDEKSEVDGTSSIFLGPVLVTLASSIMPSNVELPASYLGAVPSSLAGHSWTSSSDMPFSKSCCTDDQAISASFISRDYLQGIGTSSSLHRVQSGPCAIRRIYVNRFNFTTLGRYSPPHSSTYPVAWRVHWCLRQALR